MAPQPATPNPQLLAAVQAARLYAILDTGYSDPARWPEFARAFAAGGVGIVQIRAKKAAPGEIVSWSKAVAPIFRDAGIPLVLNDHPSLVAEARADGVHVGQDDLSLEEARRLAGPGAIVGKSTHSLEQARAAVAEGADYIGFGPIFATPTKPDYVPIGPELIRQMSSKITLPAFCIGGIKKENVAQLAALGARRVCIVSGLLQAENPAAYTREVITTLNTH